MKGCDPAGGQHHHYTETGSAPDGHCCDQGLHHHNHVAAAAPGLTADPTSPLLQTKSKADVMLSQHQLQDLGSCQKFGKIWMLQQQ